MAKCKALMGSAVKGLNPTYSLTQFSLTLDVSSLFYWLWWQNLARC